MLGERTYQTIRYLRIVEIMCIAQFLSFFASPITTMLPHLISQGRYVELVIVGGYSVWMAWIYLMTLVGFVHLMAVARLTTFPMILYSLLALCPCLGIFVIASILNTVRDRLEEQNIPFRNNRPDWQALRAMAAELTPDEEIPPGETTP